MNNNNYIKNTAILFISMAITKIIGALFKIPLANLLGGTGMGFFSTAYSLYSPVFALTAAGVPTVIMRITAQSIVAGRNEYAAAVRNTALWLFAAIGFVGSVLVAVLSAPFAEYIACSPMSRISIICISPAVAICCVASVLRGYYEGMANVVPSAAASVAEAASRAVFGLGMSYGVVFAAKQCFFHSKPFLGILFSSEQQAYEYVLPLAAAAAISAVTLSEIFGLAALVIADRRIKREKNTVHFSRRDICVKLIKETAPIAAYALIMNCVSFVDLITVPKTLSLCAGANYDYFNSTFSDVLPFCGGMEGLPNFMYGSYTGIAMSIFMLIPSFAGMTEKTMTPEIAAAWAKKDYHTLANRINVLYKSCALIGCPACFGGAALAKPIFTALYPNRTAEVSVCVNAFFVLCAGGLFIVIASASFGAFQAINKAHIPLLLMTICVAIKLMLNPLLVSVPQLNITGASIASVLVYTLVTIISVTLLNRFMKEKIHLIRAISLPVLCSAACGLSAYLVYHLVGKSLGSFVSVLVSGFCGGIIYVILLIFSGFFHISNTINQKRKIFFKNPLKKC